jgi:zinc/manganese transport system permease protein
MIEALEFLWPSFLVSVCLVGIHVYFGIQVLARRVIFVDLALAQIAALGATVAFMLGHPAQGLAAYGYSLAFAFVAALLLAFTRVWAKRVPQEALIGVIYVVAAAASILLIDRAPQGAEHLKQVLTGNILTSGLGELAVIVPLYLGIAAVHFLLRERFTQYGSVFWEFLFYLTFGIVVTSSVALAGVLLVFSFLIVPASIGVMFTSLPSRQLAIGWVAGTVTSAVGLAVSFALDLPTGAAIVCAFGVSLALAGLIYFFLRGDRFTTFGIAANVMRWALAVILAGSALQLAIAPGQDQPLLDVLEHVAPSLHRLYFSNAELATYKDADEYAERHREAAEQLIELERRRRTQGEALDDAEVRRISSFLKSYGEMRKGEQFVMNEVRTRARERIRWVASLSLIVLTLLLAPLPWSRIWLRSPA